MSIKEKGKRTDICVSAVVGLGSCTVKGVKYKYIVPEKRIPNSIVKDKEKRKEIVPERGILV
jgi:hypothetical protein